MCSTAQLGGPTAVSWSAAPTTNGNPAGVFFGAGHTTNQNWYGDIDAPVVVERAWTAQEVAAWHADSFAIYRPRRRPVWGFVPAGVPTGNLLGRLQSEGLFVGGFST